MEYSCAHCDCYDCDYLFCVLLARLIIAICVVVVLTSEALRIEGGGGKRKKEDDDEDDPSVPKNRIPEFLGDVEVKPTDSQAVKKSLGEVVDIDAWIRDLSLKDAEMLKELTIKHETRGNNDFVLLQYAQYLPAIVAVEARAIVFRIARTCVLSRKPVCSFTHTCVFFHANLCVCSRTRVCLFTHTCVIPCSHRG